MGITGYSTSQGCGFERYIGEMAGVGIIDDQMEAMQDNHIRKIAPAYADKLKLDGIPQPGIWTDEALVEDTIEHIGIAMREFVLTDSNDVYRYLTLRHWVGPKLHTLGRVRQHLAAHKEDTPPGMRVLKMIADTPANYWLKIRGHAGFESEPIQLE